MSELQAHHCLTPEQRTWLLCSASSKAGVLNLFSVKYPRVIKQSTQTPRLVDKALDFTLLHHNNARSGKIYTKFSIGTHFPLVWAGPALPLGELGGCLGRQAKGGAKNASVVQEVTNVHQKGNELDESE